MSLYLLLLEQRYQVAAPAGLLWNLNHNGAMQLVRKRPGELSALMARRNGLAAALAPAVPVAPPMLQVRGRERLHSC